MLIRAYGTFWNPDIVDWGQKGAGNQGKLLGKVKKDNRSHLIDFWNAYGVYVLPSAPSPCDRRDRLRVRGADLTPYEPSAALLLVELAYLAWRLNVASPPFRLRHTSVSGFPLPWLNIRM